MLMSSRVIRPSRLEHPTRVIVRSGLCYAATCFQTLVCVDVTKGGQ